MWDAFFNLETGSLLFGGILFACLVVISVSIFKTATWARREDVAARMGLYQAERRRDDLYPLYRKIQRWRGVIFCLPLVAILLIAAVPGLRAVPKIMGVYFALFVLCLVINSLLVNRLWRCPACGHALQPKPKGTQSP